MAADPGLLRGLVAAVRGPSGTGDLATIAPSLAFDTLRGFAAIGMTGGVRGRRLE